MCKTRGTALQSESICRQNELILGLFDAGCRAQVQANANAHAQEQLARSREAADLKGSSSCGNLMLAAAIQSDVSQGAILHSSTSAPASAIASRLRRPCSLGSEPGLLVEEAGRGSRVSAGQLGVPMGHGPSPRTLSHMELNPQAEPANLKIRNVELEVCNRSLSAQLRRAQEENVALQQQVSGVLRQMEAGLEARWRQVEAGLEARLQSAVFAALGGGALASMSTSAFSSVCTSPVRGLGVPQSSGGSPGEAAAVASAPGPGLLPGPYAEAAEYLMLSTRGDAGEVARSSDSGVPRAGEAAGVHFSFPPALASHPAPGQQQEQAASTWEHYAAIGQ